MAARLIEASSRIAVCGQPPVSTPDDALAGQRPRADQELRVFLGIDVVGNGGDFETVAQALAQRIHERGFAGAHRPADANA